jgi:hypothetical protein
VPLKNSKDGASGGPAYRPAFKVNPSIMLLGPA